MQELVRERNRRGEGGKLRADIVAAATSLLERTGSEESVTLRAVAREVGISAPSIYPHFPDREAIVAAIVEEAFGDFNAAIEGATTAAVGGPRGRVRAGCAAYLQFAADRPNQYKLLFGRQYDGGGEIPPTHLLSFQLLVDGLRDCVNAGISASSDPAGDATAIWIALHGYATLHVGLPLFPWPDVDTLLDRIVDGLGQITPG
jgi:AcrR family transcriptional regulator